MPFCPSCRSEFRPGTTECAECRTQLVGTLEELPNVEKVDIYVCYGEQQVDRVVDLLQGAGLDPLVRDRSSSAFPTNIGMTATKYVAVVEAEAERALALLKEAIEDGVITREGEVLGPAEG